MKKFQIKFMILFIFISIVMFNTKINKDIYNYIYYDNSYLDDIKINNNNNNNKNNNNNVSDENDNVLETFTGLATAYSPYCSGCSGITASSYNVKNTIYYNDKEYGNVRIVAADKKYKFGTIVKLSIDGYDDIIAIVLDRGSAIGNNKKSQIDLLFETDKECNKFGVKKVNIEVLRYGY